MSNQRKAFLRESNFLMLDVSFTKKETSYDVVWPLAPFVPASRKTHGSLFVFGMAGEQFKFCYVEIGTGSVLFCTTPPGALTEPSCSGSFPTWENEHEINLWHKKKYIEFGAKTNRLCNSRLHYMRRLLTEEAALWFLWFIICNMTIDTWQKILRKLL